jgi:hypothetical protein
MTSPEELVTESDCESNDDSSDGKNVCLIQTDKPVFAQVGKRAARGKTAFTTRHDMVPTDVATKSTRKVRVTSRRARET